MRILNSPCGRRAPPAPGDHLARGRLVGGGLESERRQHRRAAGERLLLDASHGAAARRRGVSDRHQPLRVSSSWPRGNPAGGLRGREAATRGALVALGGRPGRRRGAGAGRGHASSGSAPSPSSAPIKFPATAGCTVLIETVSPVENRMFTEKT
jgi:hypothetical protein